MVIWDLDDTLWNGTISEGPIEHVARNHDIVIALAERGIISSICSKNDESVVLPQLQQLGLSEYFVLPSIDWTPKGPRIRQLIEDLNLRPVNVLFIDDLAKNLEEARFVSPELNVALPDVLETLLDDPALAGKPDKGLKRLTQYKVLEQKISEQSSFKGDTNDFLRQSEIKVAVLPPTAHDLERLEDLINRSNQLNFTKLRVDQANLARYIDPTNATTGAVWVSDKYGDYGLAGFYALENGALTQFAFSCRILGFGVESWLYQKLGSPRIEINGEVSATLDSDNTIDWITEVDSRQEFAETTTSTERLLVKGGCDLRQLKGYLRADVAVDEEMNYVTKAGFGAHNEHTEILRQANPEFVERFGDVIDRIPFIDRATFETEFFDNGQQFKLYSVLMDYTQGIYRYRDTDFVVTRGHFTNNLLTQGDALEERFGKEFAEWFVGNFRFEGPLSEEAFEANLEWVVSSLPKGVRLILLNGAEIEHPNQREPGRSAHHRKYNAIVDRVVARHSNVSLVDVRGIVTDVSRVTNSIRHYKRDVYPILANRVDDILVSAGISTKENSAGPGKAPNRLLIKGGCDLRQLTGYLRADVDISEEMTYVSSEGAQVHTEHTLMLRQSNPEQIDKFGDVIDRIPFIDRKAFTTDFLDDAHKFKLYSVLMDYTQGIYRYRDTDFRVTWGGFHRDATKKNNFDKGFGEEFAEWFLGNFRFEGPLSEEDFEGNLEWLVSSLPAGQQLILLNGAEVDLGSSKEPGRHLHHRTYNAIVDRVVARHANVSLVDVRDIVTDSSKISNQIRHYTRDVYPVLASRVDAILAAEGVPLKTKIGRPAVADKKSTKKRSRPSLPMRLSRRFKNLIKRFM